MLLRFCARLSTCLPLLCFLCIPTAYAEGVQVIDRPDPNWGVRFIDYDAYDGRLRLLFETYPSREQFGGNLENWPSRLFVAQIADDGVAKLRPVPLPESGYQYALRRGHDALFAIAQPEGEAPELQVVSLATGAVESRHAVPGLPTQPQPLTAVPSADGNLFLIDTTTAVRGGHKGPINLRWRKFAPTGRLLGEALLARPDAQIRPRGWLIKPEGGLGIVVGLLMVGEGVKGLQSGLDTPIERKVGNTTVRADVGSETLLVLTNPSASQFSVSSALERSLIWTGMAKPQDVGVAQAMREGEELTALQQRTALKLALDQSLVMARSPNSAPIVRALPDGALALVRRPEGKREEPPVDGYYVIRMSASGAIERRMHLQPVATALGSTWRDLLPVPGGYLLAGTTKRGTHVVRFDTNGEFEWVQYFTDSVEFGGLVGDGPRAWVRGIASGEKRLLWLGRVDEKRAERQLPAVAQRRKKAPVRKERRSMADQMDKCACTCEEKASLDAFQQAMKSISTPEAAAAIQQDPRLQLMICPIACQEAYAEC